MPGTLGISAFLRQHDLSYVVAARQGELLGPEANGEGTAMTLTPRTSYAGPVRPFSRRLPGKARTRSPVSPVLKGPNRHCITVPVQP